MTAAHQDKQTLSVDVNTPEHADRVTTPLFERSRKMLIARDKGCFICGDTGTEHPLEAHHHPIERSFAEMMDWSAGSQIREDYPHFGWASFEAHGSDPYMFVDDMTVNGMLLCKKHHIEVDEGIHTLPHPIWVAQRYGKEGYQFSGVEILHHDYSNMKVGE